MFNVIDSFLLKYIRDGGPLMYPLVAASIIALGYTIERWWALHKAKINTAEFTGKLRTVLLKKDVKGAVRLCENYRGPIASILKAGLLKYGSPKEEIEQTIETAAIHEMARLERGLNVLASIANIAPILGFLGTVTGMIKSFDQIAKAGLNNPAAVAAGISEALITTASGLIIAAPTLMVYNFFTTKIGKFVREMGSSSNILLETFAEMEKKA